MSNDLRYSIEIADEQRARGFDRERLQAAVQLVLRDAGIHEAEISIAIVANARIHELNRKFLGHDCPTDVLSFVLDHDPATAALSGEIVVSAEYAAREAAEYGWTTEDELLLYVIHGCLHLVGYDDATADGRTAMREAESRYLARFGLAHRYRDEA
jgi:probable rRNA maturation factor